MGKTILAGALAILCVAMAVSVQGQTTSTVWNSVYTAEQAKRGATIFKDNCSVCHAEDLTGADGPALKGELFTLLWEGRSLCKLFQRLRRMPPRKAALPLEESRDALAFITSGERVSRGRARALHGRVIVGRDRHRSETVVGRLTAIVLAAAQA